MKLSEYFKTNEAHFLLLFLAGLALILASSLHFSISWISLDLEFGLLQFLPLSFWFGLAIMTVSCLATINTDSEKVFFAKAFLLFLIIWSLPVFFESNTTTWDSFTHFSTTMEVQKNKYLEQFGSGSYLSWPGFFVYANGLFNLVSFDSFDFLKYYRLFSVAFTFVCFFVFLKKILPTRFRFAILALTFLAVWIGQFHLSPQSLGLPFFLLLLSTLFFKRSTFWFIGLLLVSWLLLSHPTTMSVALPIFLIWATLSFFYWFIIHEHAPGKFFSQPLAAVFILFLLFGTAFFLNQYLFQLVNLKYLPFVGELNKTKLISTENLDTGKIQPGFIDIVLQKISSDSSPTQKVHWREIIYLKTLVEKRINVPTNIFLFNDANSGLKGTTTLVPAEDENALIARLESQYTSDTNNFIGFAAINPVLSIAPKIRGACIVALSILSLIFIIAWPRIKEKNEKNIYLFLFSSFLTMLVMVGFSTTLFSRLAEFTDRILLYASMFFTIMILFAAKTFSPKTEKTIIALLFAIAFLNFFTAYYNESLQVIGDQSKDAALFIKNNAKEDAKIWTGLLPFVPLPTQELRSRGTSEKWVYSEILAHWTNWAAYSDYEYLWDRRWGPAGGKTLENLKYLETKNKIFENQRTTVFLFGKID